MGAMKTGRAIGCTQQQLGDPMHRLGCFAIVAAALQFKRTAGLAEPTAVLSNSRFNRATAASRPSILSDASTSLDRPNEVGAAC